MASTRGKRGIQSLRDFVNDELEARDKVEVNCFNAKKIAKQADNLAKIVDPQSGISSGSFPLETQAIVQIEANGEKSVVKDVQNCLLERYDEDLFSKWMLYLWGGYNILLAGVGSKRNLLQKFIREKLTDKDAALVEVNGYSPAVRHTTLINTLVTDIVGDGAGSRFSNYSAKVEHIAQFFSDKQTVSGGPDNRRPHRLFLVIHNLDGENFRKPAAQMLLSVLAAAPRIHLVASVDHVRHRLMWNQQLLQRFNFVWQYVPTYASYTEEVVQQSYDPASATHTHRTVGSVLTVLHSVTANHRSLWCIVARHQLEAVQKAQADEDEEESQAGTTGASSGSKKSGRGGSGRRRRGQGATNTGLDLQRLVEESRRGFLVRNFRILTQQMKELEDHRLLDQRVLPDGV
eukprot:INCI10942.1.p1 GENE.INCI10942.1~~INCI10942.1.p1  ORF type:complete len:403 (+),score=71.77 INCI10942.1:190-1398(+)